jgi:hypothetical protein
MKRNKKRPRSYKNYAHGETPRSTKNDRKNRNTDVEENLSVIQNEIDEFYIEENSELEASSELENDTTKDDDFLNSLVRSNTQDTNEPTQLFHEHSEIFSNLEEYMQQQELSNSTLEVKDTVIDENEKLYKGENLLK